MANRCAALAYIVEHKQSQPLPRKPKLKRLRKDAPDLAARVADENLSLEEAIAILHQREVDLRMKQEVPGRFIGAASPRKA
jgi:hypothetical protein